MAIAYFNWGVELEHLKNETQAKGCYISALDIAREEVDDQHPLLTRISDAIAAMKKNYNPASRRKKVQHRAMPSPRLLSPRSQRQQETNC